jgi:hypothetical protein
LPWLRFIGDFVTLVPTKKLICTFGHSTQEGHVFYEGVQWYGSQPKLDSGGT